MYHIDACLYCGPAVVAASHEVRASVRLLHNVEVIYLAKYRLPTTYHVHALARIIIRLRLLVHNGA